MAMGTMTVLCLGMLLGQAPGDYYNQKGHQIPLKFDQAFQADIRELILYVSSDLGKTWQQMAVVPGNSKYFTWSAPTDGEYWLQVATVNRQGKQEPENIAQSPADQKMIIDTKNPFVRLTSVQRQGDEIAVAWAIQEDHPDWASFKLEYQVQPSLQWLTAPVPASATGQAKFRPGSSNPVLVRLQLSDKAKNVGLASTEVQGIVTLANQIVTPTPPSGFSPPPVAPALPTEPSPPPVLQPAPAPVESMRDSLRTMLPPAVEKSQPPPVWSGAPAGHAPRIDPHVRMVASSVDPVPQVAPTPAPVAAPVRKLPPLTYVNSPEITLDYELTKVGPSGVGSVDLWWTQNDGQTWERYAFDPDAKASGRHQRVVELPGDGVFGFQLVVKSRAGLGRKEPRAGDAPEIRVEVDTIPPVAQLFAPVPDPQRANSLILSWSAKDNNLTTHPIGLEWAERREGPWYPIAINLSNTGRYSWQLPDQLPVQVYLRLKARDSAGNEGVAVTTDPQLVDLSEPEGRLLNVLVSPRR